MKKVISGLWKGGASAPPQPSPTASRSPLSHWERGLGVRVGRAFAAGLKPRPSGRAAALFHQPASARAATPSRRPRPDGPVRTGSREVSGGLGTRDACLRVEGVAFRYPHFELAPISFEADTGDVVAIIGPNGSGKSTLLEVVSGYLKPVAGRIYLDGQDLNNVSSRRRARCVGLARQDAPVLFPFAVREFVRQGRHPHVGGLFESPDDEHWVEWALEMTNLVALARRPITEVSGGEFQRAVLARTLAQRPRLVLLDEPTANLDIGYQIEMLRLLRELAATEEFVAVIVTHELNLAAEFADYLLLLEGGQCLRRGTPSQVLDSGLLSRVFRTPVLVDQNPSSGRPRVTWVMP